MGGGTSSNLRHQGSVVVVDLPPRPPWAWSPWPLLLRRARENTAQAPVSFGSRPACLAATAPSGPG